MFTNLILKLELLSINMIVNHSVKNYNILETLNCKIYTLINKDIDYKPLNYITVHRLNLKFSLNWHLYPKNYHKEALS